MILSMSDNKQHSTCVPSEVKNGFLDLTKVGFDVLKKWKTRQGGQKWHCPKNLLHNDNFSVYLDRSDVRDQNLVQLIELPFWKYALTHKWQNYKWTRSCRLLRLHLPARGLDSCVLRRSYDLSQAIFWSLARYSQEYRLQRQLLSGHRKFLSEPNG